MKKIFPYILVFFLAAGLSYFYFIRSHRTPEEVHYHAGFLVYVDGVLQDYAKDTYMRDVPCALPGKKPVENDQIEKAHLHDNVGDVVHVERTGAVWNDLFINMGVDLPKDKPLTMYRNGAVVTDPMHAPILPGESVVFVIGSSSGVDQSKTVGDDHIREIGAKSESCGTEK